MVRRRRFLQLFGAGVAGNSAVTTAGARELPPIRDRPTPLPDEYDADDWLIQYTVDVSKDGRARVTLTLEGSEIPDWVRIRKQRVQDLEIHRGEEALTHGDYSVKWDTTASDSIEYSVQLGHLRLVRTKMAVLDDSVIFRDRELAPVGSWEGGTDALPQEHRITIQPPDGWSAFAPGREVDTNTYDLYPSTRVHNPFRDLFAVGDFTVQTETVDGTEIRVAELPSADGPPVEDALSLLADAQPIIESQFDEQTAYPKAGLIVPTDVHPAGGFARDNSFIVSDNKPLYDTETGESHYVHEFAHTWQRFSSPDWQVEGPLTWLQMLALYETDEISEAELRHMLQVWSTKAGHKVGDPIEATANDARHEKGAAVSAALDVDIRARTDGGADIGSFISRINDQRTDPEYSIDREEELAALRDVTGVDYTEFFERFVDGTEYPAAVLSEDFSVEAPSTVWGLDIQLSGVEMSEQEIRRGEVVTVTADVVNTDDVSSQSTIRLFVDDESVVSKQITLNPGETTTIEFEQSFDELGDRTLRVGDQLAGTVTVLEHQPEFVVDEVELNSTSIDVDETVIVTADIENTGKGDGTLDVELLVAGRVVETTTVQIPAHEDESVTFSHQFESEGEFEVAVNEVVAGTVSVDDTSSTTEKSTGDESTGETTGSTMAEETKTEEQTGVGIPGFGILASVSGLAGAGHLLARRLDDETDG